MQSKATSPAQYIKELPDDRKAAMTKLRKIIKANLPKGFKEVMNYGMIGYVVPHSLYPDGYHCDPKAPLPFMNIASQKNHISVYHSGVYANPDLLKWFTDEFPKHSDRKLNMGKSCVRFSKPDHVTYDLIGELASKISVDDWIALYEKNVKG
jgi:uncharacterized protein YdhG (YjbR/CyaY superfamily)